MADIPVPVDELAVMAERMERQAEAIRFLKARLRSAQEAHDALQRLVQNMKEAAGIEGESDPIEALMRLREKAE